MKEQQLLVKYLGEEYLLNPTDTFDIGREGDLSVDDNPYLHRIFLHLLYHEGMWWIVNVGTRIAATLVEESGGVQSWLAPGTRLPLVFQNMVAVFTAGQTTYEVEFETASPDFALSPVLPASGETTVGGVVLTPSQRLMLLALSEPMLARLGTGPTQIPKSADAARRIGWSESRFNRKIDNVCEKLDRVGVKGLRGEGGGNASQRRARLVEYAVGARLVTRELLPLLDEELKLNTKSEAE